MKTLVLAGGSGFLGNILIEYFKNKFDKIIILSRSKTHTEGKLQFVKWDAKTLGSWVNYLNNSDVLINLAGKSVDCRYNQKNKDLILSSRLDSTNVLNKAILRLSHPPKLWINSSTATIYRHSTDKEMDEYSGEIGSDFSMDVAKFWEHTFFATSLPETRKVAIRTSIVLGKQGGALLPILKLTKLGFGGRQGTGDQLVSWIHKTDFARAVEFIIDHKHIEGIINVVAPKPVKNKAFMESVRKNLRMFFGFPLNEGFLKLGARVINTETELILKSRNVIPLKLQQKGFYFLYPSLESALKDLLAAPKQR
ncbi:TIGR01777 family protein [Leptobacterium flavescens]|uniref:TIGR01777 family protein n=1 Tax=Leptobacterium flavescens TaxID=472055 RepID=A0A6P0UWJ7_9FLAO|nr:TIGR01777 family oxidoreductase [Leptobacterium flavescens]NER15133.1 TIGR01777 family protein [Leptobacterium flavescens]